MNPADTQLNANILEAMVSAAPADTFLTLERDARDAGRGLWSQPTATNTPPPARANTPAPQTNCDPSYPDVCIPSFPPDLNCDDIPYRRFTVLPPDPHRFDGDDDGLGCEN